jgi:tetratricopeptide (TPR) repeat protein
MHLTRHTYALGEAWSGRLAWAHHALALVAVINIVLAVLNLIPIPPLDGSKIWPCLIPGLKPGMKTKSTWIFIVVLVVLVSTRALDPAIRFVTGGVATLLPASDGQRYRAEWTAGVAELEANRYAAAEEAFTRALEINPHSGEGHFDRAVARAAQEHWQGALEDGNRAIEIGTDLIYHRAVLHFHPEYFEVRAKILDALGRPADANADREWSAFLRGMRARRPTATSAASAPEAQ